MAARLNLEELKKEYIGKEFGWLTILDVYRDNVKGRYFFKCRCHCGKEVEKQYDKVVSGHTSSCGCFKFTKEYSEKLCKTWASKPDLIRARAEQHSIWCKKHPDNVAKRTAKRKKTYEEHPEILERQIANRKETLKNNPDIQNGINKKLQLYWDDERKAAFSNEMKQLYADHPEYCENVSLGLKQFYEENPCTREDISIRNKKWAEENQEHLKQQGVEHSEKLKKRRLTIIQQTDSDDFKLLLEIIHPLQRDLLLSGDIKASSIILTKCQSCGKYDSHKFNNVWRLNSQKFKIDHPPYCSNCRDKLVTSSYEIEIAEFISTFYSGELIRNTRYVISPQELDLYYPDKKIAIEFNGNYFHDEDHKPRDYHISKFKECNKLGITLISVFENDWKKSKDSIMSYIKDTFNDVVNKLSYVNNTTINLNYPPPNFIISDYSAIKETFYMSKRKKIYTCGVCEQHE